MERPLFLFCVALALLFAYTTSGSLPEDELSSPLLILDELRAKILFLESSVDEKTRELRNKDERIRELEKTIQDKSETVTSIENQLESLPIQKVNYEQKIKVYDTKHAHQDPQDKTMRSTDSTSDKPTEVLEKKAQLGRRSQPHMENILNTWIPALKKMLLTCITYLGECIASLTSHTVELYHFTKKTALPHAANARETATHAIKPYASRIVCACEESIKSACVNLSQTWIPALKKMLLACITYNALHH